MALLAAALAYSARPDTLLRFSGVLQAGLCLQAAVPLPEGGGLLAPVTLGAGALLFLLGAATRRFVGPWSLGALAVLGGAVVARPPAQDALGFGLLAGPGLLLAVAAWSTHRRPRPEPVDANGAPAPRG